jgi:hypothetical protein
MAATCSLRRFHVPKTPATDSHHVIPQAWQHFYVPSGVATQASTGLWDARTVEVCPNCHRRVHEAIVAMMRNGQDYSESPLEARRAAFGGRRLTREQIIAYEALLRFKKAGGSLVALRAHRLLGAQ